MNINVMGCRAVFTGASLTKPTCHVYSPWSARSNLGPKLMSFINLQVEGVPVVIKKLVKKEEAEAIIEKLKEVGAVVVME